jgi:hypothetical protein
MSIWLEGSWDRLPRPCSESDASPEGAVRVPGSSPVSDPIFPMASERLPEALIPGISLRSVRRRAVQNNYQARGVRATE